MQDRRPYLKEVNSYWTCICAWRANDYGPVVINANPREGLIPECYVSNKKHKEIDQTNSIDV